MQCYSSRFCRTCVAVRNVGVPVRKFGLHGGETGRTILVLQFATYAKEMIITVKAPGFEPLSFTSEIPAGLAGYYIPGSKIMCAAAGFGSCMIQLIDLDEFGWLYSVFDITEEATFFIRSFTPVAVLRTSLRGDFHYESRSTGKLLLKEGRYQLFFSPELHDSLLLTPGRHELFESIYPPHFVSRAFDFFPVLDAFGATILRSKPALLSTEPIHANALVMDIVHSIIHTPYASHIRKFHIDSISGLLSAALQQASAVCRYNKKFTPSEAEKIHAAKEFIDTHAPAHYSIFQVARHAGMNDQKLKKGFKELFGTGLYAYLQARILDIAKIEIEQTTRSIKEIGAHAGYKSANNFSAAFKKKFGISPAAWRKQYGDR